MGEIERRYPIGDMPQRDAVQLFRIIARERKRGDLLRFPEETIVSLVKRVKCYPLLIKWSIGQVCLGKDINEAFSQIYAGESEIAKFSFNDVFNLLSDNSKLILYSMILYGEKPSSRFILMHLSNLNEEQFEDAIKELLIASFVFPEAKEIDSKMITEYSMLTLTRGFVESKLDDEPKTREMLHTRYFHLAEQIKELEKAKTSYSQSLFSLGIKTIEERVAFDYVKAAKVFYKQGYIEKADVNFQEALRIAPKFGYVLIEYSKYESARGHNENALKLAKNAAEANPDSYHPWFHMGSLQRRLSLITEAIESLRKAKELNPNHLPIYNELGRAYTFSGNYERASEEFSNALKEEKYPNYRHKLLTHSFLADNYKRWAEAFGLRYDRKGQIEMLQQGWENAKKALEIKPKDKIIWKLYWNIRKDLGIVIWKEKGIDEGLPILKECLGKMEYGKASFNPDKEMISEACYFIANLCIRDKGIPLDAIQGYIEKGLENCATGTKWLERINEVKRRVEKQDNMGCEKRLQGKIKSINLNRRFGIKASSDKTFLFFFSGLAGPLYSSSSIQDLIGKSVSFILVENENQSGRNRYLASDIDLEN